MKLLREIITWLVAAVLSVGTFLYGPGFFALQFDIPSAQAAQFGRPDSDVSLGGMWDDPITNCTSNSNTDNVWDEMDESTADDDTTCAESGNNPVTPTNDLEVGLSNIINPGVDTGHVIRFRARKTGTTKTVTVVGALYQGTTRIAATAALTLTTTWATQTYTLTSGEASNITDYIDLRIRFESNTTGGGAPIHVLITWAEFETTDAPADLTWATGAADFKIYQDNTLTWGAGTLVCSATLTDNNAETVSCASGDVAASTQYRVQVVLKNGGGMAVNMNGAAEFVDHKVVKTGWAGTAPTMGSCGFNDLDGGDGSTTCSVAFNGNDVRITNTGAGDVVITASGSEGFMYLITTDTDVPSTDSQSYMDTSIDSVLEDSSKITITGPTSGPTTEEVMRHGNWFSGGVEQSFFWAD